MTQEPNIFPYIARLLQGAEVVWKPLGEVAEYIRGITYNKQAEIQHKDGWKVLRANNITLKSRQLDFNDIKVIDKSIKVRDNQHLYKGDILICAGSGSREHIGKTAYIFENLEYIFGGFMGVIRTNEEYLLSRFLFHYLGSSSFSTYLNKELNSSTINNLNSSIMNKFQIPLPPLSVQQEIVRILDKFTQLEAELEAELDCRKQQYEYYRNKLLSYEGNEVEWKTLDQISENLDSKRQPITSGLRTSGKIPYYGASGIVDYVEDYIFDGDFLLISEDGANLLARNTPIAFSVSGKIWVNNHAHILKFRTYEERRFIEFYLNKTDLTPYISGAAQPKLNKKNLNSIKFPIPPLEEQQRIVSILDKFDTLVNSISEGLPKEIALRRKQYEYYRERLLSF